MGNPTAPYITTGTFKFLQEINNSAVQKPTPKVGDTKYADVNGDGVINAEYLVLKVDLNEDKQVTVNLVAGKSGFYKI